MFELKLNMYTIQKSADKKVFWLFTEKSIKKGKLGVKIPT